MLIWRHEVLHRAYLDQEPVEHGVGWRPELDIYEDRGGFVLCLAVPGVGQEDIDVFAEGQTLTVGGTRKLPIPNDATTHRVELPRGRFQRQIRLPAGADLSGARTQLKDGLLLIHVPKVARETRVKVDIRTGG
jgi:HSP20 family protein